MDASALQSLYESLTVSDGLRREDLRRVTAESLGEEPTEEALDVIMQQLDRDGDGTVSLADFEAAAGDYLRAQQTNQLAPVRRQSSAGDLESIDEIVPLPAHSSNELKITPLKRRSRRPQSAMAGLSPSQGELLTSEARIDHVKMNIHAALEERGSLERLGSPSSDKVTFELTQADEEIAPATNGISPQEHMLLVKRVNMLSNRCEALESMNDQFVEDLRLAELELEVLRRERKALDVIRGQNEDLVNELNSQRLELKALREADDRGRRRITLLEAEKAKLNERLADVQLMHSTQPRTASFDASDADKGALNKLGADFANRKFATSQNGGATDSHDVDGDALFERKHADHEALLTMLAEKNALENQVAECKRKIENLERERNQVKANFEEFGSSLISVRAENMELRALLEEAALEGSIRQMSNESNADSTPVKGSFMSELTDMVRVQIQGGDVAQVKRTSFMSDRARTSMAERRQTHSELVSPALKSPDLEMSPPPASRTQRHQSASSLSVNHAASGSQASPSQEDSADDETPEISSRVLTNVRFNISMLLRDYLSGSGNLVTRAEDLIEQSQSVITEIGVRLNLAESGIAGVCIRSGAYHRPPLITRENALSMSVEELTAASALMTRFVEDQNTMLGIQMERQAILRENVFFNNSLLRSLLNAIKQNPNLCVRTPQKFSPFAKIKQTFGAGSPAASPTKTSSPSRFSIKKK